MAKAAKAAAAATTEEEDLIGGEGDNSRPTKNVEVGSAAARKLKAFLTRIEKSEAEKQEWVDDIKSIYQEVKAAGYETKVVRALVKERKKDKAILEEFESLMDLYRHALGMAPAAAE